MIGLRSAVANQALMVRAESSHFYPSSLANKPIAVQFHAGSHYTVLRLLEGYIPKEKIKLLHYGSPRYRFEAMMSGEVDAAMLMEPWIALAEKNGCRSVCEGHYLGAENASDNMDDKTFAAINRAVSKAVDLINSDKKRFLHYLIESPKFVEAAAAWGGLTVDDFHLPRLRYTYPRPYTEEQLEDTYNWMVRWDLLNVSVCATDLVDNRDGEPVAADD